MRFVCGNALVAAGLVGVLSLGVMGCGGSQSNTSAAETSTQGESAVVETSSGASDQSVSGTTESTSSESGVVLNYLNNDFGIGYTLPEGYDQYENQGLNDRIIMEFCGANDAGSEVYILLSKNVTDEETISDEASWADYYAESLKSSMEEDGETDIEVKTGSVSIGGNTMTAIRFTSQLDGATFYRELFLKLGSTGDGLSFMFQSTDEAALHTMEQGVSIFNRE